MAVLLWEGKSKFNGGLDIGVFASFDSNNRKTGKSVQIWILLKAEAPHVAQKTGRDEAVCGSCPQRPTLGGNCYVTTFQAPNAVWRQWAAGECAHAPIDWIKRQAIKTGLMRFGAYGDPALIPLHIVRELTAPIDGKRVPITGYTHMWRQPYAAWARDYLMASCDSESDAREAAAAGWRYFRVSNGPSELSAREVVCPASVEGGEKLLCNQCKACDGLYSGKHSNIVIQEH